MSYDSFNTSMTAPDARGEFIYEYWHNESSATARICWDRYRMHVVSFFFADTTHPQGMCIFCFKCKSALVLLSSALESVF
jgi:hypothetical protein